MFLKLFLSVGFAACLFSTAPTSACVVTKDFVNLTKVAASRGVCVLADNKIECFTSKYRVPVTPPKMTNPVELASNAGGFCALADEGVQCWGRLNNNAPKLKNPRRISVQRGAACAETDEGIRCWNYRGEIKLPTLAQGASEIALGGDWDTNFSEPQFGCALTKGSVSCWGNNYYGQASPPKLVNPRQLAVGESHICALTDDGVKCWGSWEQYNQTTVPKMGAVTQLVAGDFYAYCALEETGRSVCWGAVLNFLQLPIDSDQISAGYALVCGKNGNSVTCAGETYSNRDYCPDF